MPKLFSDAILVTMYAGMCDQMRDQAYYLKVQHNEISDLYLPKMESSSRVWTHEYLASIFGGLIGGSSTIAQAIESVDHMMAHAERRIEYRVPQSCEETNAHYKYKQCYKVSCILRGIAGLPDLPYTAKLA